MDPGLHRFVTTAQEMSPAAIESRTTPHKHILTCYTLSVTAATAPFCISV
jgi:hypothetical protein